ncbi:hypothetical protein NCS52_01051100 [Fusarium sp. LHS14.1]|nr:hypothetical protein NCS52_01051100 [Fusarium sp. LHS14.1]
MQHADTNIPSLRFIRLILKAILIAFSIGSFVTFILAAITAGGDWPQMQQSALSDAASRFAIVTRDGRGLVRRDDDDDFRRGPFGRGNARFANDRDFQGNVQIVRLDPNDPAWLPFFFLSAIAFLSWLATAFLLYFVFARGRSFGTRFPRYVFKVIALIVLAFAPVFVFGWLRNDGSFSLVCKSNYAIGLAALVLAHLTFFVGIFLTFFSAIFDLPPTDFGLDSRRTSATSGA